MTQSDASKSSLEHILKRRIADQGPLRVSDYMQTALYHPEFGYYVKANPIGAAGDFVTAPEISQMFGELIGLWCLQAWRDMGSPSPFRWIELGPGRGTLMQDALRATQRDSEFTTAAQICLVEKNEYLKACQAQTLGIFDKLSWFANFEEIPEAPFILVANEFFDCLPIDQFVFQNGAWFERKVGMDPAGKLAFEMGAEPAATDAIPKPPYPAKDGDILEFSAQAISLVGGIAARLRHARGHALIIDYGYQEAGFGDTLQALKRHKYADVLKTPGQIDITAHVNFGAVAHAAVEAGAAVHGPAEQGAFLSALGLQVRADALKTRATPAQAKAIAAATDRLAHPDQMGRLFKVLTLSSPELPTPPGFPAVASAKR